MANNYVAIVAVLLTGAAVSYCLMPAMMVLARRNGIIDVPGHRKIHAIPVPFLGGVGLFLGVLAGIGAGVQFSGWLSAEDSLKIMAVVLATTLSVMAGLVDDKFKLRARYKFLLQLLICVAFATWGYRFDVLTIPGSSPHTLGWAAIPVTVFWMLALINGMNLIDGIDGLAGTVAAVAVGAGTMVAAWSMDAAASIIFFATLGSILAFLAYNSAPAKIYLGDAGSAGLGTLLATSLVCLGQTKPARIVAEGLPAEAFVYQIPLMTTLVAYPLFEVFLSVARRTLKGKHIATSDQGHVHHRLLKRGWRPRQICLAVMVVGMISAGIVLCTLTNHRGLSAWLVSLNAVLVGIGLHYCGLLAALNPFSVGSSRPHFLIANYFIRMQTIKIEIAHSTQEVVRLLNQACAEFGIRDYTLNVARTGQQHLHLDWAAPLIYTDRAPAGERNGIVFCDSVQILDGLATAAWSLQSGGQGDDIDIEHRVLFHDFVSSALARLRELSLAAEMPSRPMTVTGGIHVKQEEEDVGEPLPGQTATASGS